MCILHFTDIAIGCHHYSVNTLVSDQTSSKARQILNIASWYKLESEKTPKHIHTHTYIIFPVILTDLITVKDSWTIATKNPITQTALRIISPPKIKLLFMSTNPEKLNESIIK